MCALAVLMMRLDSLCEMIAMEPKKPEDKRQLQRQQLINTFKKIVLKDSGFNFDSPFRTLALLCAKRNCSTSQ